jgi:hypothetical protein
LWYSGVGFHFHRNTVEALGEVVAAAGLEHPSELAPRHFCQRTSPSEIRTLDHLYDFFEPDQLLEDRAGDHFQRSWDAANTDSFSSA